MWQVKASAAIQINTDLQFRGVWHKILHYTVFATFSFATNYKFPDLTHNLLMKTDDGLVVTKSHACYLLGGAGKDWFE